VRTAIVYEGAPVPLLILVLSVRPPFLGLDGSVSFPCSDYGVGLHLRGDACLVVYLPEVYQDQEIRLR